MGRFSQRLTILFSGFTLGLATLSHSLWADAPKLHHTSPPPPPASTPIPWLTGPLLAPSGHVIPKGHLNVEPYEYITTTYGVYDKKWNAHSTPKFYTLQTQLPIQYGFANRFDLQVVPNAYWKHTDGASHWDFGDMVAGIDYQLVNDKPGKWWPAVRLTATVNIPFGKYDKLKASKLGTDIGGIGTWEPTIAIVFSRLFTFSGPHFLATRFYFGYNPTVPVHVSGLNAYGGAKGTRGKVYPGNAYVGIIGLEYTLTQRWALAMDIDYTHLNKTRFTGKTLAPVGAPSSEQLSFSPAIEYNWSAYVGAIAGCWFTAAGRNSPEFASAVIAVNIYR